MLTPLAAHVGGPDAPDPLQGTALLVAVGRRPNPDDLAPEADSKQLLGAAVLGVEDGEVRSVLQTAVMGRLPVTRLKEVPYAHPTLAESLNNLFAGTGDAEQGEAFPSE